MNPGLPCVQHTGDRLDTAGQQFAFFRCDSLTVKTSGYVHTSNALAILLRIGL